MLMPFPRKCLLQDVPGMPKWEVDCFFRHPLAPKEAWQWKGSELEMRLRDVLGIPRYIDGEEVDEIGLFERSAAEERGARSLAAKPEPPLAAAAASNMAVPDDGSAFGDFSAVADGTNAPAMQAAMPVTAAPPPAAAASPPVASDDGFGDFGSMSAPVVPAAPPVPAGVGSLLDLDLLGGPAPPSSQSGAPNAGGSADLLNSTMAQFGMSDMLASLDSLEQPPNAAAATTSAAWLDSLPDLSYVLSASLSRPQPAR